MSATAAQVRQWSDDVARDPASTSFVPLAEAYRQQGRADAALRLCLRGLERNPTHVEAHYLLGRLYAAAGDALKAFDEWDIALRLSPEHARSRREIGLLCAARGDWPAALRHLERAAASAPDDAEIAVALTRARAAMPPQVSPAPAAVPESAPAEPGSLHEEFEALASERGILGILLLDGAGYVLAGSMGEQGEDSGSEVAAALAGTSPEAERAVRHLELGTWRGILLQTPEATVRLAPAGADALLAVAARRSVPTGWVLRMAARARAIVATWLGEAGEP